MACVQPYAVNPFNFLRWHPAAATILPFAVPLDYCQPLRHRCSVAVDYMAGESFPTLPVVAGDELSFFINSQAGVDISNGFASVGLGLAQDGKLVTPNAGTLFNIPDPKNPNGYFLFGKLGIDCEPDGLYWPVIYDLSDLHVLLIANPVEVVNWQPWQRDTVLVKFRHNSHLFDVKYGSLPNFYQQFRLNLSMHKPDINFDEETYTDRNNYTRRTHLGLSQVYNLETDFWDPDTYRAASIMLAHREVYINDILVKSQGGLASDPIDGGRNVGWLTAKGKVLDLNFSRAVLTC